ncbi:Os04g0351100 [Oryza sativa Japonica Group]|uniref:Os04g0351100 protein n=1 Tax=Oryza sativa subsp. japonica TaxID=39947 RepID=A0A0P0W9K0_ORYSJ|nr:Os04g0351100 [Oryza sativa Japonica Group]
MVGGEWRGQAHRSIRLKSSMARAGASPQAAEGGARASAARIPLRARAGTGAEPSPSPQGCARRRRGRGGRGRRRGGGRAGEDGGETGAWHRCVPERRRRGQCDLRRRYVGAGGSSLAWRQEEGRRQRGDRGACGRSRRRGGICA